MKNIPCILCGCMNSLQNMKKLLCGGPDIDTEIYTTPPHYDVEAFVCLECFLILQSSPHSFLQAVDQKWENVSSFKLNVIKQKCIAEGVYRPSLLWIMSILNVKKVQAGYYKRILDRELSAPLKKREVTCSHCGVVENHDFSPAELKMLKEGSDKGWVCGKCMGE